MEVNKEMKKAIKVSSLVCLGLVVVFLLFARQSYALDIASDAIAGTWLFDDDPNDSVKDSSANGNDGVLGPLEFRRRNIVAP